MTDDDSPTLTRLISAVLDQAADCQGTGSAELVRNEPQSSFQLARRETPFQPHLWPQPSVVAPQHMRCLCCGVYFWEQRAERPCPPPDQNATRGDFDV